MRETAVKQIAFFVHFSMLYVVYGPHCNKIPRGIFADRQ